MRPVVEERDRNGRLTDDSTVFLGEAEYAGQVEIQAKWGEGFPQAEAISGRLLKDRPLRDE